MDEAEREHNELQHDAKCWRALRKLMDDAAARIEKPGAAPLMICWRTLSDLYELIVADTEHQLARTPAALHAVNGQLSQPQIEHLARDARDSADRSTKVVTLILAALAEGRDGRWPALFPEQKHTRADAQIDGNYAVMRGYLATKPNQLG